jgi:hypothetical protein
LIAKNGAVFFYLFFTPISVLMSGNVGVKAFRYKTLTLRSDVHVKNHSYRRNVPT